MKKLIPFNYFGGKYTHAEWVIHHLPQTKSYVEAFGGSAVILLNKKQCAIETYNDVNSIVVNFFRVLRERPDQLIEQIYLTPYSKEEYFFCYKNLTNTADEVELARRFFVTTNQSFNGTISRQTGWKMSTKKSRSRISEAVNRWKTSYRGDLVICSSKKPAITPAGFALVIVKLFDCKPMKKEDEKEAQCPMYEGAFAWHLENFRRIIKPVPVRGNLGFFTVDLPEDLETRIIDTLPLNHYTGGIQGDY